MSNNTRTLPPKFIDQVNKRRVTAVKRRRGLFKKAIELSSLCGLEFFLVVFDPEMQKITELKSNRDFDVLLVNHMLEKNNVKQFKTHHYTNRDYDKFLLNRSNVDTDEDSAEESYDER